MDKEVARPSWIGGAFKPPEAVSVAVPTQATLEILIETVTAAEHQGFSLVREQEIQAELPVRVANVLVDSVAGSIRAVRRGESGHGWPRRPYDAGALVLGEGQTGRIIRNYRHSGYHGWSYEKVVVNVANLSHFDAEVFTSCEPDHLLDEQASLF